MTDKPIGTAGPDSEGLDIGGPDRDRSGTNDDWFTFDEATTRLAALVWVEQQLVDVLELWAMSSADAAATVAFGRAARHHEWHASLLVEALATSPQLDASARIVAPTSGWTAAATKLKALESVDVRLTAVERIVEPWLEREIGALRDLANRVSDRDHDRLLGFVSLDHTADHAEIRELLAERSQAAIDLDDRRELAEITLT